MLWTQIPTHFFFFIFDRIHVLPYASPQFVQFFFFQLFSVREGFGLLLKPSVFLGNLPPLVGLLHPGGMARFFTAPPHGPQAEEHLSLLFPHSDDNSPSSTPVQSL